MSTLNDSDLFAVGRDGKTYKTTLADIKSNRLRDTDLFIVGRGSQPYHCTFADLKKLLAKAPVINLVTLADSPEATRFTSATFASTVSLVEGIPVSTKGIKAWIEGLLKKTLKTDTIAQHVVTPATGWKTHTTPVGTNIQLVSAPEINLVVCGRNAQAPLWSTDGVTWHVSTGATGGSAAMAWAPDKNLFVSGENTHWNTSTDGKTWTPIAFTGSVKALCYSQTLGLFVGVGGSSTAPAAYTSSDGVNWATHTLTGSDWYGVAWSPDLNLFCAVSAGTSTQQVATSPDGITWTRRTTPSTGSLTLLGVIWAPGLKSFVAVGNRQCFFSKDGITWTKNNPVATGVFYAPAWSDELHMLVVAVNANIYASPDGATWFHASTAPQAVRTLVYDTRLQLFVGAGGSFATTSKDLGIPKDELVFTTNAGLADFHGGEAIKTEDNAASGFVSHVDVATKTMRLLNPTGTWNVGQRVIGPTVTSSVSTKLYCKLNAGLTVTDLQSADPGYTTVSGTGPYTVTFPATLPSGNAPDTDLPAGTTLTTEVQASNASGTVHKTSNTITPA